MDDDIKEYVANASKCRQDVLIGDMDNYTHLNLDVKCLCCDICCKSSQCGARKSNLNMFASCIF